MPTWQTPSRAPPYLGEDGVLAAGVQLRVGAVVAGQLPVDVELGHGGRRAALRALQALRDEGRALLGQQQERLHALAGDVQLEA